MSPGFKRERSTDWIELRVNILLEAHATYRRSGGTLTDGDMADVDYFRRKIADADSDRPRRTHARTGV